MTVIFAHNGPCGGVLIPVQRVMSLHRHVQVNAHAVYCLCCVVGGH